MADVIYNSVKSSFLKASINLTTNTIKVALVTSSYTPNQDTHDFFDDVTNEVTGAGYTAGGVTLASKTVTEDAAANTAIFDAADVTWAASTITAAGAVIYKSTGVSSTSNLIAFIDFGSSFSTISGTFQITWSASGILYLG